MRANDATIRENRLLRLGRVWMLVALVAALSLGLGGDREAGAAQPEKYIGEAQARAAALAHAGLAESDVTVVKMKRYDKRGGMLYDIVFLSADARYRYEIDAVSGEILAHHRSERHGPRAAMSQAETGGQYIGMERAKEIAFAHAKVSPSAVRKLKVELDRDHSRMIYEIEFEAGRTDYEYEIDAETGEILMWEADRD